MEIKGNGNVGVIGVAICNVAKSWGGKNRV